MFYLKEPKSNKDTPIYLIYRINGKSLKLGTGEKIHPNDWDFEGQYPKRKKGDHNVSAIKAVLQRIQDKVNTYVNSCKMSGEEPSMDGLREQFRSKKVISFNDYVEKLLEDIHKIRLRNGDPLKKRTIQSYNTTKGYLDQFAKVKFDGLDLSFHRSFIEYLEQEHGLATNTIGGYIKNLKKFAAYAKQDGYPVNEQVFSIDFFVPVEKSESIFLNEKEIDILFKFDDLTDRERKVRDWAIIGLWTGLRVSDWDKFKPKGELIEIETEKTGRRVVIPLHPQVKEVIKNGLPERCSDVEFNRVIKKVCEKAGIKEKVYGSRRDPETNRLEKGVMEKWKMVSSHTCRRSFATNNYLMGIDTLTIMNITGHTTEKNFLKYIKVTPKQHAKRLLEKWNEYYQTL
nr:site-specific integrase [uncultured Allomuricauda sp.]